jgi:hypothetical protein
MAALRLTKGLGLIEGGIKVFEDIDWQQQQATSSNKERNTRRSDRRFGKETEIRL